MRYFLPLVAACVTSLLLYLFVFGFLIDRPLTIGEMDTLLTTKLDYAASIPHPKIVVLAGSNARYSHSCAVISDVLKRPCANMGVTAEIGLDWVLDRVRPTLKPGDFVYMPLEYDSYSQPRGRLFSSMDAAFRFRHQKMSLLSRGAKGLVQAAFLFDLPALIRSIGEMALQAVGVHRRASADAVNAQGDEIGHDDAQAAPYIAYIRGASFNLPEKNHFFDHADGTRSFIAEFLDWCHARGVTVAGGLPTVFNDHPLDPAIISRLKGFYRTHKAEFVVLPNQSQYPRQNFFDTPYHLRESWQIEHSRRLATMLESFVPVSWRHPAALGAARGHQPSQERR